MLLKTANLHLVSMLTQSPFTAEQVSNPSSIPVVAVGPITAAILSSIGVNSHAVDKPPPETGIEIHSTKY